MQYLEISLDDVRTYLIEQWPDYQCPCCKSEVRPSPIEQDGDLAFTSKPFYRKTEDSSLQLERESPFIPLLCQSCGYLLQISPIMVTSYLEIKERMYNEQ